MGQAMRHNAETREQQVPCAPSPLSSLGSEGCLSVEPPVLADDACFLPRTEEDGPGVTVLTWNVAAVNNNPFEYWIHYPDAEYIDLMSGVESFLDEPGEFDVPVESIFTEDMFRELLGLLRDEGHKEADLQEIERDFWHGGELGLKHRLVVSGFIKDPVLGAKRLISMPDRVTNTVNVVTQEASVYRPPPACRPCVINNYEGDLSSVQVWWENWKLFMFRTPLTIRTKGGTKTLRPVEMLDPIPRSKYPAVTPSEERLAIPLQVICQAIFDAVLIHLMNRLSPANTWQIVKSKICSSLYRHKHERTLEILAERYSEVDVMCLQEVAAVFRDQFSSSVLRETHELFTGARKQGKRDQNSMVLLRKKAFHADSLREMTIPLLLEGGKLKVEAGDFLAVEARGTKDGRLYIIVSFHGDTNGLLTLPVLRQFHAHVLAFPTHNAILCLDANVYEKPAAGKQDFAGFIQGCAELGMVCCFGENPDAALCRTTCNARTSLQPQLNKAVRYRDRVQKSDKNPKDQIMFYKHQLGVSGRGQRAQLNPIKDNTGKLRYMEDTIFPTLDFPSDHGIVAVSLTHL